MRRLTWEDEVRLSDALHHARVVRKRLDGSEPTTPEDRAVLEAGAAAADELVVAHSGLAKRCASDVLFGAQSSATLDFEDLVQVGLIAMYSCAQWYDARARGDGVDRDTGNRFSVYSRLYIKREMYRALKRGDSILTGSIATSDRTREWLKHKDALEERLGRQPTPREVSDYCDIPVSAIDLTLVGRRVVLDAPLSGSDDGGPTLDVGEPDDTRDVDDHLTAERYTAALDKMLRQVLAPDEADAFMLWIGTDRSTPRSVPEVAKEMGVKVAEANELIGAAVARMRHPQNVENMRVLAREAIASIEEAAVPLAG